MTKNQFAGFRANFLLAFIAGSFLIGVANTSANVTQDLSEMQDLSHWAVLSLDNNGLPLSGSAAVVTDITVGGSAVPQGILIVNSSTVRLSGQSETIDAIVANRMVMSDGSSVTHPPLQSP
jgi:hypothetical protein